jgi:hypothetical protein
LDRRRDRRDIRASARRGTYFGTYSPEEAARIRRAGGSLLPAASAIDRAMPAEVDAAGDGGGDGRELLLDDAWASSSDGEAWGQSGAGRDGDG